MEKDRVPARYELEKLNEIEAEQKKMPADQRFKDFHLFDEFKRQTTLEVFTSRSYRDSYSRKIYNLELSRCDSCGEIAVWLRKKLVYPPTGPVGLANADMPPVVRELYDEAGAVFQTSPKSSAALLRLALQHLLLFIGGAGKNINDDINSLIDYGLDEDMAKAMHALRIIGNESVHSGKISVDDEPYIAEALFDLLNQIVDQMITRPKRKQSLWERLPESKRTEVEKRLVDREKTKK